MPNKRGSVTFALNPRHTRHAPQIADQVRKMHPVLHMESSRLSLSMTIFLRSVSYRVLVNGSTNSKNIRVRSFKNMFRIGLTERWSRRLL